MSNVLSGLRFVFRGTSTCNYLAQQLDPLRIQLLVDSGSSILAASDRQDGVLLPRASFTDKWQKVDKRLLRAAPGNHRRRLQRVVNKWSPLKRLP